MEEFELEGNIAIARFMGYEEDEHGNFLLGSLLPQFRGSNHGEWCGSKELVPNWEDPNFLELYKKVGGHYWEICPTNLRYSYSWDWIMTVVEKIESIRDEFHGRFGVYISSNSCAIQGTNLYKSNGVWGSVLMNETPGVYYATEYGNTKLEATFVAVIKFLKWYNDPNNNRSRREITNS